MTDWKTTLTGFIASVAALMAHFGILLSPDLQMVILAIGLFLTGWLAKDKTPTP